MSFPVNEVLFHEPGIPLLSKHHEASRTVWREEKRDRAHAGSQYPTEKLLEANLKQQGTQ